MIQLMFAPTLARPGDIENEEHHDFDFDEFKP